MTPRQRRLALVIGIVAGVSIAGALALGAFRQNVTFFFDPTSVADGKVPPGERFRLGGMVTEGSVHRSPGSLEVHFVVTDFKHDVPVSYTGVLPDLFREGTGVVAHGRLGPNGTFVADEVLAKHDEKYMPPEVAKSLKRRHGESRADATAPNGAMANEASPSQGTTAHDAAEITAPSQGANTHDAPGITAPSQGATAHEAPEITAPGQGAPAAAPAGPPAAASPSNTSGAGHSSLAASSNHSPAGT